MSANMSRRLSSFRDWTPWVVILTASLACASQAALRAWPEYEMSASDPGFRRQSPATIERIQRAAKREMGGHPKAAEHELLIAAANDRRFLSAWALANFYHRQGRDEEFWPWAARAIEMSHGDRTSLYALLLRRGTVLKVRELLPQELCLSFATYLISADRLDDAIAVLADLDTATGRVLAERLMAKGRFEDALSAWNQSQSPPLSPDQPSIENADFRRPPTGMGFDWRLGPGARHSAGRLVIAPGDERGEFASQYVLLSPNRRYRLRVEQDTLGTPDGLRWQLDDLAVRNNLLRDAAAIDGTGAQTFEFRTPPGARFARLALASQNSVRGTYAIRGVRLDFAD